MCNYDLTKIGKRIRDERQKAGYTSQEKFAEKFSLSGSSRQKIGKWENGKSLPSLDDFLIMCDLFQCQSDTYYVNTIVGPEKIQIFTMLLDCRRRSYKIN